MQQREGTSCYSREQENGQEAYRGLPDSLKVCTANSQPSAVKKCEDHGGLLPMVGRPARDLGVVRSEDLFRLDLMLQQFEAPFAQLQGQKTLWKPLTEQSGSRVQIGP